MTYQTKHGPRTIFGIALDPATLDDWRRRAQDAGLSIAAYVRRCVQGHDQLDLMAAQIEHIHATLCPHTAPPDLPEEAQAACQILQGLGWTAAKARMRVRAFVADEPQALAAQIVACLTGEEAKANGH